jgi:hypothetical protein
MLLFRPPYAPEPERVIPAQAGIHTSSLLANAKWIPACAGMTIGYQANIAIDRGCLILNVSKYCVPIIGDAAQTA